MTRLNKYYTLREYEARRKRFWSYLAMWIWIFFLGFLAIMLGGCTTWTDHSVVYDEREGGVVGTATTEIEHSPILAYLLPGYDGTHYVDGLYASYTCHGHWCIVEQLHRSHPYKPGWFQIDREKAL